MMKVLLGRAEGDVGNSRPTSKTVKAEHIYVPLIVISKLYGAAI